MRFSKDKVSYHVLIVKGLLQMCFFQTKRLDPSSLQNLYKIKIKSFFVLTKSLVSQTDQSTMEKRLVFRSEIINNLY
jgi:hypothetical protein